VYCCGEVQERLVSYFSIYNHWRCLAVLFSSPYTGIQFVAGHILPFSLLVLIHRVFFLSIGLTILRTSDMQRRREDASGEQRSSLSIRTQQAE